MKSHTYAIIDVETTFITHGDIPRTKFWGYADCDGYKKFKTTKELSKFIRGKSERTILHHTNFDLLQLLVDKEKAIEIRRSHDAKLIRCSWHEKHTLLNSYATFPLSMASIFTAFGHEKTPFGCKKHQGENEEQENCPVCNSILEKRNYDDCVLGLECFLKLDKIFSDISGVSPLEIGTIAGTGFTAAENCAGKMPKDLRFVEAYRGGRVEVFDLRKKQLNKYDINSSYPFSFFDAPNSDVLLHLGVWTRDWHCPFFDEFSDDLLLFPNGKFSTWIYQSNYERYIRPYAQKTKIKILEKYKIDLSWLKNVCPLISDIYDKKSKSEGAIKLACKLLINAMYGRIGLRGQSERARFLDYLPDGDNLAAYKVGNRWLAFDTILREPRSNYPFASYITDNARARLYSVFSQTSPYYGDTDSIFSASPHKKFPGKIGKNIGEWTHEGKENFQARNVKDYVWGDKEILKGGKGSTIWTLKRFAQGKGAMVINKERRTELRKRIVNDDGTTDPIIVP